jgi:hypothetical protein
MSLPTMKVLVGFQTTAGFGNPFQLDNATYGKLNTGTLGGYQLVDLTSQVLSVGITRGKNRQLDQFNAGTASIRFKDPQRILDPLNTASPYYPYIGPRMPVQVYANEIPIYTGVVGDWNIDYSFTEAGNITTAACVDNFTVLANNAMDAWTPSSETPGARIQTVLIRPEVLYQGGYQLDTGLSTLGTAAVSQGANTLSYLQTITASEQGFLFIDASGTLVFRGRDAVWNPTPVATFGDTSTYLRYQTLQNSFGDELLYNYVALQAPPGAVQIASDSTSIALYQSQQYSKLDLLNSADTEVASLASYVLYNYRNPVLRFTGVSVQLASYSAANQNTALGLDFLEAVTVSKSFGSGSPTPVTQTVIVTGVQHTITPGSHVVRFTFDDYPSDVPYLTLDSTAFGKLNVAKLGF